MLLRRSINLVLVVLVFLLPSCHHDHDDHLVAATPNTAPVANAGSNQDVAMPTTVTLDGTGSTDADGDTLTYAWTLTGIPAGSAVVLSDATAASPTFTPDVPGYYVAQLVVSDGRDTSSAASVSVAVSGTLQLIANGSFENGLTGWTVGTNLGGGATGTSSYNGVVAPGTETLTSVAGFPATDGTHVALGSVSETINGPAIISSVLYQDVAIPANATTASFSLDIGIKDAANGNNSCNAAVVGIYSDASVPAWVDSAIAGGVDGKITYAFPADTTLRSRTSLSIDISSRAGTTVRFAIINAANFNGHEVIGIDNVKLNVVVSYVN